MLPEMTTDEYKRYFTEEDEYNYTQYKLDILAGRLHICDVPFEYRDDIAYVYACRHSLSIENEMEALAEKKVIEHLLLDDIIARKRQGSYLYEALQRNYYNYFGPGCNVWNSVSLM